MIQLACAPLLFGWGSESVPDNNLICTVTQDGVQRVLMHQKYGGR